MVVRSQGTEEEFGVARKVEILAGQTLLDSAGGTVAQELKSLASSMRPTAGSKATEAKKQTNLSLSNMSGTQKFYH